jgi:hypothetical protein
MKKFSEWLKEKQATIEGQGEDAKTSENTRRAGISDNYPDAYANKKLYPPSYFMPKTATAKGKLDGKIGS